VHEHGRLKKQKRRACQFADVKIDIAPRERGEGFQFIDKIVGGSVPRNFIPAVVRRRRGSKEGTVRLPGGGYIRDAGGWRLPRGRQLRHGVQDRDESRDEGRHGESRPVLLEPVDHVTIACRVEFTPRAQRLLTGRRGQILGFSEKEGWSGWDDVVALVPEAELHDLNHRTSLADFGLGDLSPEVRPSGGDAARHENVGQPNHERLST